MTTIRDVAQRAGVSVATVSRVMNGSAHVSPALRERVWEAIKALNYSPSALARGLNTRISSTIGVCVPSITKHPFWAQVVSGIEDECLRSGYNLFLCHTESDPQRERDYIELLRTRRADGIVLGPSADSAAHLETFLSPDWPLVLVDRKFRDLDVPAILVDNYRASLEAVEYLIRLGHHRIGVIAGSPAHTVAQDRIRGYRDALTRNGIPLDERLIRMRSYEDEHAYAATRDLLSLSDPPTALFSCSGRLARGILHMLQEEGVRIPEEMSFLTFDDYDWMTLVSPPLTAIAQPAVEMGRQAMQALLRLIRGAAPLEEREVILKTTLMERASCAPPGDARRVLAVAPAAEEERA
ncbi:MAG: LacI family DNA-binding transcriptional regulator [Anaerolineae bacterium]